MRKEPEQRQGSDLPPLRLSTDDQEVPERVIRKKQSASFWDLEALRRDREKGSDHWSEQMIAPDERDVGVRRGNSQRRRVDSPIEMVDRSRPW